MIETQTEPIVDEAPEAEPPSDVHLSCPCSPHKSLCGKRFNLSAEIAHGAPTDCVECCALGGIGQHCPYCGVRWEWELL
jgi:hypothetical protein